MQSQVPAAESTIAISAALLISSFYRLAERFEIFARCDAFGHQELSVSLDRIHRRVGLTLFIRSVQFFVVGQRVRIRTNYFCVDKRRSFSSATIIDRVLESLVRRERIRTVAFLNVEIRESGDEFEMSPPAVPTSTGTEIA
jgi:hypothetical protein